jgi:hypothetical protein
LAVREVTAVDRLGDPLEDLRLQRTMRRRQVDEWDVPALQSI